MAIDEFIDSLPEKLLLLLQHSFLATQQVPQRTGMQYTVR
jgi:hypothetical protein